MPVRPEFKQENLYFITTSTERHSHIFRNSAKKQIIVDCFNYMRVNGWINLYCFILMPNHIHIIAKCISKYTLSDVMREFKKHTSKTIIQQFQSEKNQNALHVLNQYASRSRNQQFKVWEDGYDAREVFSLEYLEQKMDYIHHNPCQPQWNLVKSPEDYQWSSVRFYILNQSTIIEIDDVRDILV